MTNWIVICEVYFYLIGRSKGLKIRLEMENKIDEIKFDPLYFYISLKTDFLTFKKNFNLI